MVDAFFKTNHKQVIGKRIKILYIQLSKWKEKQMRKICISVPEKEAPHIEFLESGKHVFNFKFDIPENIPSSFEGTVY